MLRQKYRFIVCQILGWCLFTLVHITGYAITDGLQLKASLNVAFVGLLGFLISSALRPLYQYLSNKAIWVQIIVVLEACYIGAAVFIFSKNLFGEYLYFGSFASKEWLSYAQHLLWGFFIMLCWSLIYFVVIFNQQLQMQKHRALHLSSVAHQAQLKMLRYQLNPHFLFNTLNAISSLILIDERKNANDMTVKLSEFLRCSLDSDPLQLVELQQEVHMLQLYLQIEQVRFCDRLEVEWQIDKNCEQALVPSLILQPLIENAIKHAIAIDEDASLIGIRARKKLNQLELCVYDDGPGADLSQGQISSGSGVGLKNIRERLQTLYPERFEFYMQNLHGKNSGFEAIISLPLEFNLNEHK
ncbi:sensor histidine kinase [Agaribacterium haliotis]|uniref:sensor histidine kinase n=1 Tax=Agaribacterium haliotis TaxID=2013869 RepID=UPI000BB55D2B|nr:histidine kinase [Agaribacterium haliotis]